MPLNWFPSSVSISNDRAFVTDMLYGIQMVDVFNPDHAVYLGTTGPEGACSVVAVGNLEYMGGSSFTVFSVTGSTQLVVATTNGSIATYGHASVVSGQRDYVTGGTSGMYIVDISNYSSPTALGVFSDSGRFGKYSSCALSGNNLVAISELGFSVFHVERPAVELCWKTCLCQRLCCLLRQQRRRASD